MKKKKQIGTSLRNNINNLLQIKKEIIASKQIGKTYTKIEKVAFLYN